MKNNKLNNNVFGVKLYHDENNTPHVDVVKITTVANRLYNEKSGSHDA